VFQPLLVAPIQFRQWIVKALGYWGGFRFVHCQVHQIRQHGKVVLCDFELFLNRFVICRIHPILLERAIILVAQQATLERPVAPLCKIHDRGSSRDVFGIVAFHRAEMRSQLAGDFGIYYDMNASAPQRPTRKIQIRAAQIRAAPIRVAQIRVAQIRVAQIRVAQIRVAQIRVAQIRKRLYLIILDIHFLVLPVMHLDVRHKGIVRVPYPLSRPLACIALKPSAGLPDVFDIRPHTNCQIDLTVWANSIIK
jgi:hypothetical protein